MFETHAGTKIDEEAVMEVMTRDRSGVWFLDMITGEVVSDGGITRTEIPVISDEKIEKEISEYIGMCSQWIDNASDARIADALSALDQHTCAYADMIRILKTDDSWMVGWREWISIATWDELRAWILSVDDGMREVVIFDCSCVLCHDMVEHIAKDPRVRIEWDFDSMHEQED